ncbi:DUF1566 domain-containing protein [Telluria beijingensis]|uniref:Lcl C-terminal domain-containing protein n=1 Tax=Telluria beijingensis TaxID=3068633 RepID=UPI0027953AB5|nr:DUF1566 domain-containing protein [Massilia sp. REN29]
MKEKDALLRQLVQDAAAAPLDDYLVQLARGNAAADGLAALLERFDDNLARLEALRATSNRDLVREVLAQTRGPSRARVGEPGALDGWHKIDDGGRRLKLQATEWRAALDTGRRLMWTVNADRSGDEPHPCRLVTWHEALKRLTALNFGAWCGHRDWRIPTIAELNTLTYTADASDELRISARLFPDLRGHGGQCMTWSSSRFNDTRLLDVYDFAHGTVHRKMVGETAYLRFVRTMGDNES